MKVNIVIQFGDIIGIFTDWHIAERYVRVCQNCYLQWCGDTKENQDFAEEHIIRRAYDLDKQPEIKIKNANGKNYSYIEGYPFTKPLLKEAIR